MIPQPKTCPKCGGQMKGDRILQALGIDLMLVRGLGVLDDKVQTLYCEKCGYIEIYRVQRQL